MNAQQAAPPRKAYTVREVAESIGISTKQMYRLIARGDIEAKVLGGVKLIPAEVFDNLVADAPSVTR